MATALSGVSHATSIAGNIQEQTVNGAAGDPERGALKNYFKCLAASIGIGLTLTRTFPNPDSHLILVSILFWLTILLSLLSPFILSFHLSRFSRHSIVRFFSLLAITCTALVIAGLAVLMLEMLPEDEEWGPRDKEARKAFACFLATAISAALGVAWCLEVRPKEEKRGIWGTVFLSPFHVFNGGHVVDREVINQERYQKNKGSLQSYFAILAGYQGTVGSTSYAYYIKLSESTSHTSQRISWHFAWATSFAFTALILSLIAQMILCNLSGSFSLSRRIALEVYGTASLLCVLVAIVVDGLGRGYRGEGMEALAWANVVLGLVAAGSPVGFFFYGEYLVMFVKWVQGVAETGWEKAEEMWEGWRGGKVRLEGEGLPGVVQKKGWFSGFFSG